MKISDSVKFQTVQFLFIVRKEMLQCQLHSRLQEHIGGYKLREELNFKIAKHRTMMKSFSPTKNGVRLWNGLDTAKAMFRYWPI